MSDIAPPLLVDAMLGRLARWLRHIGYDAAYLPDTDDHTLVQMARSESRVILTADRGVAARRGVQTVLIKSYVLEEQIAQVQEAIGHPPEPVSPRCGKCNTPLEVLHAGQAKGRVPPYILRSHHEFTHCPGCRRVYWRGTHWQAIQKVAAAK